MGIDAEQVKRVFMDCLSADDSGTEFDMIVQPVRIDLAKAAEHKDEIRWWLMELPEQFRESKAQDGGGGWSFLQACMDRHGSQWTGLHERMGMLFVLGQAVELVSVLLPREMWDVLPGGMPYYAVRDT